MLEWLEQRTGTSLIAFFARIVSEMYCETYVGVTQGCEGYSEYYLVRLKERAVVRHLVEVGGLEGHLAAASRGELDGVRVPQQQLSWST